MRQSFAGLLVTMIVTFASAPGTAADSPHTSLSSKGTKEAFAIPNLKVQAAPASEGTGKLAAMAEAAASEITPWDVIKNLPSIESKLAGGKAESVCGTDTRARVTATTSLPWRTNCQLIMTDTRNRQFRGTGWLGGKGTVFTAGHCVHEGKGGTWYKKIEVIPGMNGATRPYGTFVSSNLRTVSGWVNSSSPNFDYGAIILASNQKVGNTVGYYGFSIFNDTALKALNAHTAGYPGDKPSGQQFRTNGTISSVNATRIFYMMDTFGGQSGSALYRSTDRIAVGIHAYGGCPNGATRINQSVFNNLLAWRNLTN